MADRVAESLLKCGAGVHLVSPSVPAALQARLTASPGCGVSLRGFHTDDIVTRTSLVFLMDGSEAEQALVVQASRACHVPLYVYGAPHLSTFAMPEVVGRSPVQCAVTVAGASQAVAQHVARAVQGCIPGHFGSLVEFSIEHDDEVRRAFPLVSEQEAVWQEALNGHLGELLLRGQRELATNLMDGLLQQRRPTLGNVGEVYLVGAGPGDPDLLTFKALRLLQKSDVVVYDRLVSSAIIDRALPGTELVYVGKAPGNHLKTQAEINAILVDRAKQGKKVCRLKGGDPFIFGRGGEEMEALMDAAVPFQVVPGITAATGCACYAGIPLTHRHYAQSVRFVTGHLKDESADLDWSDLARPHQTVVFYMALGQLEETCAKLLSHGVPPTLPAAIVSEGTLEGQRICVATVATLFKTATAQHLRPPSILIVGEVVALRQSGAAHLPRVQSATDALQP
eukprot:EG_transcript_11791